MHGLKLVLFLVLITVVSSCLLAQNPLKQGVYSLGGSVSLTISNEEFNNVKYKYFNILLAPSYGYFVTKNISINGRFGFSYMEYESSSNMGSTHKGYSRYYSLGVGVRYYFDKETIIPFIGIGGDYSKSYNSESEGKGVSFIGGINYFISKEVALEPFLSYSISSYNGLNQNSSDFRFGVSINYYLTE